MTNLYYKPQDFNLEVLGEVDSADSYEFDKFVVWTDGTALYWGSDEGCSCPTPFDWVDYLSDLATSNRVDDCLRELENWVKANQSRLGLETSDLRQKIRSWSATR